MNLPPGKGVNRTGHMPVCLAIIGNTRGNVYSPHTDDTMRVDQAFHSNEYNSRSFRNPFDLPGHNDLPAALLIRWTVGAIYHFE
jgi:hypothetical protein